MKKQYPYSNNKKFLSKIDKLQIKNEWVKITLLEYSNEKPLKDIEGKVISGTLTKTGDSIVRRTCNLSCAIDIFKYNIEDIQSDYSISKKIYLELGITNDTDEYLDEKIIWFPQGIFFITSCSITTSSTGSATINLQFKDKMAQLDGTVGGTLPATVRFDMVTSIVNGTIQTKKTLIYDIIMETVNHFGNEDISNIIIDDVPRKAKRIIRWMGEESLWIYPIVGTNNQISYDVCFTSDLDEKRNAHTPVRNDNGEYIGAKEYKTNQNIGYVYEDFVYDEELTFDAGSKVTDVLDKIKNWLGNYEYFYDEQGQFHFQEIKNYLNNAQSAYMWDKIINETSDIDYLYESTRGKNVYTFDDNINLISITNTPSYENIKNDFIVEGTVNAGNNIKHTCRYHLVIDEKPSLTTTGYDNILIYTDPINGNATLAKPKIVTPILSNNEYTWTLPEFAKDGEIYGLLDEPKIYTYKRPLVDMLEFAECYNNFVTQENNLIAIDDEYDLTEDVKISLINLLEKYMGYIDNSSYKTQYNDIVLTLARQLQKYNIPKQTPNALTVQYYTDLYNQFESDVNTYGSTIQDIMTWCGCLLQVLYSLFDNIGTDPSINFSDYIDDTYWPSVNIPVTTLWDGIAISNTENNLKTLRKEKCLENIRNVQIKQEELNILIEQYGQIINNYNIQIAAFNRQSNIEAINELTIKKDVIQNQINIYKEELKICEERLTILYAVLTALNCSSLGIGEIYYNIDIEIPVRSTSFWYYNINDSKNAYGWNKLEWYQYYCTHTDITDYYPDGLGSMTYIDYSAIDWNDNIDYKTTIPSMNRYSDWYRQSYITYAKNYDLPYFDIEDTTDTYIPTNWRTELLLMGMQAEENGTDPGYYYQELKANWPSIYDFKTGRLIATSINYIDYFVGHNGVMIGSNYIYSENNSNANANASDSDSTTALFKTKEAEVKNFLSNYENNSYYYFFDMIDSSSPTWGEYCIKNIGRRTNVNISDSVNCIFAPDIPDYAFLNVSNLTIQQRKEAFAELEDIAENIIQVTSMFYDNFATGGFKQSAYEQIRYDLQQHTSYQNVVSITATPCFYLEPNTRVELNDHSTNTYGDYVIKSISIPLGIGNNMSVSLSKAFERI